MATKEEWERAEKALSGICGYVKFKIDGYDVAVQLERWSKMSMVMVVYVNGKLDLKWMDSNSEYEESQRFCMPHKKSLLSQKTKNYLKKQTKKFQKQFYAENKTEYTYYEPVWKSFRSMKAHFIKNNESIEIVDIAGV